MEVSEWRSRVEEIPDKALPFRNDGVRKVSEWWSGVEEIPDKALPFRNDGVWRFRNGGVWWRMRRGI